MSELASASVREAILASRDQSAAVGMMLQASSLPDPALLLEHAQLVLDGRVSPMLLWARHPIVIVATLLMTLLVLLMVKRLVLGTRPKVVVRQIAAPQSRGRKGS
jgi:hypothetical protein